MSTYTATATREGKWWMIEIPALDGLTQARHLADAELMAREWIAVTTDTPLEEVTVTISISQVGDVDVVKELAAISADRARAAALEQEAINAAATLAKKLANENIPVRDIGAVMGISFQRAHQLVKL